MSRALEGVRVLDLSRLLPGPFATMLLADMGATVDKVEDPGGGDYLRQMPPHVGGMNAVFQTLNRGKRSLVLDLKKPAGRDALLRLLPCYDVLVDGFRPGVMERMGLGWDALRAAHPGLVYCAITGYGLDGPLRDRAGHDLNYLAQAGVLGLTGPPEGPPQVPGVQLADIGGGGLFAAVGILGALLARARTGEGRVVDVSMCEGSLAFALFGFGLLDGGMLAGHGRDVLMGGIAPYRTYRTKDGQAMSLGALEPKFWAAFCGAVGLDFDMAAIVPGPHQAQWIERVAEIFAGRTRAEWEEVARATDCCLEPVLTVAEARRSEQHHARGVFLEAPTADGGTMTQIRTPVGAPEVPGKAPAQGEQGAAILAEHGFTAEEIEALRAAGVTR